MAVAAPVGIVLSLAMAPMFAGITYGVSARSASSLVLAVAMAFVTGLLGTTLPVLRAGRANIVAILRGD